MNSFSPLFTIAFTLYWTHANYLYKKCPCHLSVKLGTLLWGGGRWAGI
jgi:hypothetical protein